MAEGMLDIPTAELQRRLNELQDQFDFKKKEAEATEYRLMT